METVKAAGDNFLNITCWKIMLLLSSLGSQNEKHVFFSFCFLCLSETRKRGEKKDLINLTLSKIDHGVSNQRYVITLLCILNHSLLDKMASPLATR